MKVSNSDDKAFQLYKYYLAVKLYISGDYDIVKYQGKIKFPFEKFMKKNDFRLFKILSRQKNAYDYVLANLLENGNIHVSEMLDNQRCENVYIKWIKREESRSQVLKDDLELLHDEFDTNFIMKPGEIPYLLELYYESKIGIDTLCLLNSIVEYLDYWDKNIKESVLYPEVSNRIKKSRTFIRYSTDDYVRLVKNRFERNTNVRL